MKARRAYETRPNLNILHIMLGMCRRMSKIDWDCPSLVKRKKVETCAKYLVGSRSISFTVSASYKAVVQQNWQGCRLWFPFHTLPKKWRRNRFLLLPRWNTLKPVRVCSQKNSFRVTPSVQDMARLKKKHKPGKVEARACCCTANSWKKNSQASPCLQAFSTQWNIHATLDNNN